MKTKRILCVLLAVMVLATTSIPAFAATAAVSPALSGIITPYYTYIPLFAVSLDINSMGKSTCEGSVILYYANYTCSMTMKLQRYTTSWTTVKTWNYTGGDYIDASESYYVTAGYDYRVYLTVKVYNQNGTLVETENLASDSVYY